MGQKSRWYYRRDFLALLQRVITPVTSAPLDGRQFRGMIRSFNIVSALLRHEWAIEPTYAQQHQQLIEHYLAGKLDLRMLQQNAIEENGGVDPLTQIGYAVASADESLTTGTPRTRYSLDSEEIPENSVFVLDIRGAIMKDSTCCTMGTEDYAKLINRAYAHDSIIGIVLRVDSPGGQLHGTPTLFDAIKDPRKPVVSVIDNGLMASAAYWLACGSDEILATQKSDQVGSIGVFVSFRTNKKQLEQDGIEVVTVYSDRSPQKNKPFRDAIEGDTTALREDLNYAADLFRATVEEGRGDRLKAPKKGGPDVFEGGLFYASQAIELGLIDGWGNLDTAVARVAELAKKPRATAVTPTPADPAPEEESDSDQDETDPSATVVPPIDTPPTPDAPVGASGAIVPPSKPDKNMSLFGDKHKKISALAGVEAAAVTDEMLNDINADLDTQNIKGVRVISQTYLDQIDKDATALASANATIATLTKERDTYKADADKFGSQAGHLGTKSQKPEEKQTEDGDETISDIDAELRAQDQRIRRL